MVESVASYGCEVWLLKTEEQRKLLALEIYYLRRVSSLQKIPNTAIRSNMQAEQSILHRIQRRQLKCQRRFTSGHCTVGGEEEDRNDRGGTK